MYVVIQRYAYEIELNFLKITWNHQENTNIFYLI